ncbi:MAG: CHAD domain-containing protein [Steroidobacteraceae bacterium]
MATDRKSGNAGPRATSASRAAIMRLLGRMSGAVARAGAVAARNPGPENLHALRITVRRLRAVLRALERELNPRLAAELQFDLKNVTRETSAARDADVRRQLLMPRVRDTMDLPVDLKRQCAMVLEQARLDDRRALKARMREGLWTSRLARIRTTARHVELVAWMTQQPLALVQAALGRVLRDLQRRLARKRLGAERLHRVRRRIRAARYAAEALLPMVRRSARSLAGSLQALQDQLGLTHDLMQTRRFLDDTLLPEEARGALAEAVDRQLDRQLKRSRRKLIARMDKGLRDWEPWLEEQHS